MRVIIYVPQGRGTARSREAIERELRRRGHEVVGATDSPTEAWAARASGQADRVAGRPEHLVELSNLPMWASLPRPWAISVSIRPTKSLALAVLAGSAAWAWDQLRHHPARSVATTAAGALGLAAVLVAALGLTGPAGELPLADPSPSKPSAIAPTGAAPTTPTASAPSAEPEPSQEGRGASAPERYARPSIPSSPSSSPRRSPRPPASPSRTPSARPTSPSPRPESPSPKPDATERRCLVDLNLDLPLDLDVELCVARPFGRLK